MPLTPPGAAAAQRARDERATASEYDRRLPALFGAPVAQVHDRVGEGPRLDQLEFVALVERAEKPGPAPEQHGLQEEPVLVD